MSALFVTGTGTSVGKTLVAAALCRQFREAGRAVCALKPVMSGYDPAVPGESDAGVLLAGLERAVTPAALAAIAPWRFAAPLSPDMAAAREGRRLALADIVAFCRAAAGDPLLIEGVGGVMVPLDDRHTVADWMAALGAPVLLVAGSYLGTISHTLTALAVLRGRGLRVAGLVVSESPVSPVPPAETVAVIARHAGPLPVAILPRLDAAPAPWRTAPDLLGPLGLPGA